MGAMASQITSLIIVYPTVYSGAEQTQTKQNKKPVNAPQKMASSAENDSIWWRHHEL